MGNQQINFQKIQQLHVQANEKLKKLDRVYMNIAKEVATLSHCVRSKVGAILVKDGNIISMGYNGTPKGFDNCCEDKVEVDKDSSAWIPPQNFPELGLEQISGKTYSLKTKPEVLHAEMNAVLKAAKTGNAVEGSTLYITLMPCLDCSKYLLQSGIKKVVYLDDYRDSRGVELLSEFINVEKYTHDI